jgi:EAL domain-containing protein (putative c-di-GMP-specific phosphodiesterase class I)
VRIALDDFGTGYASLSHLKQYPVDILKIDRSFVSNAESSSGDAAIVDAIVHLGRSFGIAVVAEGVETRAQADYLRSRGCPIGQGFLFGRPQPASETARLLRHLNKAIPGAV